MDTLPKCLLIVTAEVDPEIEADWNRWYDEVHLPAALACPGVLRGRRYVTTGPLSETLRGERTQISARIYTTVYELDGPQAVETPEFQAMRGWARFAPKLRSRTQVVETLN
jgi:hypothetical protein